MTKVLVDTNIVIDLLAKREGFFFEAAQLFSLSDRRILSVSVSSLTFANTGFILSRQKSSKQSKEILRKFKTLVKVVPLSDKIIELALSDDKFKDFEDGLQYFSALENGDELIITRNKKDFKNSELPVLTAKEYLATL